MNDHRGWLPTASSLKVLILWGLYGNLVVSEVENSEDGDILVATDPNLGQLRPGGRWRVAGWFWLAYNAKHITKRLDIDILLFL